MSILEMLIEVSGYEAHYCPIDFKIVRKESCPTCGQRYNYRGFKFNDSYRAFCVCFKCDTAEEF